MRSFTWPEVIARRVAGSHLARRAPRGRLVEVVRDLCGLQAQAPVAAELGLAARVAGLTQAAVREEICECRTLARAHTIRGTIHLVPADELPLWMAAIRRPGEWYAEWGLTRKQADALFAAIADALDGRELLRQELADEVVARVGDWPKERLESGWNFLVGAGACAGVLCYGPQRGAKVTFVRPDQWLGRAWRELDHAEARAHIFLRFLRVYGPATPNDFGEWFGLPRPEARALADALAGELEEVDIEGKPALLPAGDPAPPAPVGSVRLLPQFDCYVLGFRRRERLVSPDVRELFWDTRWRKAGRYEPPTIFQVLLVDGVVAGKWERRQRGKRLEIAVETAAPLTRSQQRELEEEAGGVAAFFGLEATLSLR